MRSIQHLIPRCFKPLAIAHDKWMTADWAARQDRQVDRVLGMTLIESARRSSSFQQSRQKEFNSHVWVESDDGGHRMLCSPVADAICVRLFEDVTAP